MPRTIAHIYMLFWGSLCLAAAILTLKDLSAYSFASRGYLRFLSVPWKLVTFAVALGFFVLVAPYSGDPTWDRIDASFMSVLTYLSAPWAVGTLYHVLRGTVPRKQGFVAGCVWMFSASWSYDGYIFFARGFYPPTWWSNLVASSVLYIAAGLFWNLCHIDGRGVVFGFMNPQWPALSESRGQTRIAVYALVFIMLVVGMMIPFVWEYRGLVGIR